MTNRLSIVLLLACAPAACTKPNPALCCTDAANCASLGISTDHMCTDGLVCIANSCVAETCSSNTDCNAQLPFCASTGLCEAACETNAECPGFGGSDDAICSNGSCVQCVMNSDCAAPTPVCDANVCVQCATNADCSAAAPICAANNMCANCGSDGDCASNVCGANGSCVDPADIVYLDPGGTDGGSCTSAAPCRTIAYAATQTNQTRQFLSLTMGTYNESSFNITSTTTAATSIEIHGHGAGLVSTADGPAYDIAIGVTIRDLSMSGGGHVLSLDGTSETYDLQNVTISNGGGGLITNGTVTAKNLTIFDVAPAIFVQSGSFSGDRIVAHDVSLGIELGGVDQASVQITNALVYNVTQGPGFDVENATGTVASSTVANTGDPGNPGGLAFNCKTPLTVRSSILWTPGFATSRPVVSGCNVATSIAGPTTLTGVTNADPMFVNAAMGDFHIQAGSPAIDQVNTGPADDFEGDARPQGMRYDIGADEFKP